MQLIPKETKEVSTSDLIEVVSFRNLRPEVVEEFTALWREGVQFPPLVGVEHGERLIVIDGAHRLEAARRAGVKKVRVTILDFPSNFRGSATYLIALSLRLNFRNSLRPTREEVKNVVKKLYEEFEDHGVQPSCAVKKIAGLLGCSERTVWRYLSEAKPRKSEDRTEKKRKFFEALEEGASLSEAARVAGIKKGGTACRWKKEFEESTKVPSGKKEHNAQEFLETAINDPLGLEALDRLLWLMAQRLATYLALPQDQVVKRVDLAKERVIQDLKEKSLGEILDRVAEVLGEVRAFWELVFHTQLNFGQNSSQLGEVGHDSERLYMVH